MNIYVFSYTERGLVSSRMRLSYVTAENLKQAKEIIKNHPPEFSQDVKYFKRLDGVEEKESD
jgi:hypothetical protein